MEAIKYLISSKLENINGKKPLINLIYEIYLIIHSFLEDIITYTWMSHKSQIAFLGGIIINCPGSKTDLFLPLMFEVRNKN